MYSNTSMTPTSSLLSIARRYLTELLPQKQTTDPYIEAFSRSIVVGGASERVFSYSGISQYNGDRTANDPSTSGLAALNFARIVFSMEQSGLQDTTLLQAVLARACVEVHDVTVTPPSGHRFTFSTGNHGYMRIMVGQPSSRSRGDLSHSLV